jgi:hypothetical protein
MISKLILAFVRSTGTASTSQIETAIMPWLPGGVCMHNLRRVDGAIGNCRSRGLLNIVAILPGIRGEHLFS